MTTSRRRTFARIPDDFRAERFRIRAHNIAGADMLPLMADAVGHERITLAARCTGFSEDENGVTAFVQDSDIQ